MDNNNKEETRKTAVYVIGTCDDKMNYVRELSELMRGESYWLAHTALQAVFRSNAGSLTIPIFGCGRNIKPTG